MDLSLKIRADFDEASNAFKKVAESSEYTRERIEKFIERFKDEQIDKFIDRQNLAAAAMAATGRDADTLSQQINTYQREIERLIKSGLDPQDEAIQKLQSEYITLKEKQEAVSQSTEDAAKTAAKAAEENSRLADMTGKLLDAHDDHERTLIKLNEQKKELKDQIQDLIKSGISPESDEVKKLENKYNKLTEEVKANEAAHKMQEKAVKAAKTALAAIGAAVIAAGVLAVKAAANMEDQIASLVPMMGGSTEAATKLFKTIQKEAATTPFEIDSITASVRTMMPAFQGSADEAVKAFRMLGDTAQGNSQKLESITNAYTKAMMKNKVSMQELNAINAAGVPIFNEMAESMGITVEKLMEMSKKGELTGEHLTGAFQKMTSEGGLFFNGMDSASDTLNMRILGIKENMTILAGTIGEKILPMVKDVAGAVYNAVASFNEWIQQGNNFEKMMNTLIYVIGGVTAGLVTFIAVTKGAAAIQTLTTVIKALENGFKGLNTAMKANIIGAIASIIIAFVIPAIISLYKNWDTVKTYIDQGVAGLVFAFQTAGSAISMAMTVAFNAVKIAGVTVLDFIVGNLMRTLGTMLDAVGNLIPAARTAANAVNAIGNSIGNMREETTRNSLEAIQNAENERRAAQETHRERLELINEESRARRAAIEEQKNLTNEEMAIEAERINDSMKNILNFEEERQNLIGVKSLRDRLSELALTEQQMLNEQIDTIKSFLIQRANLENVAGDERIEFFEKQKDLLLNNQNLSNEERLAAEEAIAQAIFEINNNLHNEIIKLNEETNEEEIKTLSERLNEIKLTEQQSLAERINEVTSFLQSRLELESDNYEEQINYLLNFQNEYLSLYDEGTNERIAIEQALNNELQRIQNEQANREKELLTMRAAAYGNFFGAISSAVDSFNKDSINAFYFARALASSEAFINSYLAFTKALTDPTPMPTSVRALQAGAILASGLAAQGSIWSAKPPSAETGGRFIVPRTNSVDGALMRVNQDEVVNITPRGMTGNGETSINLKLIIDSQVITDIVNIKARAGELYTLQLA